MRTIISNLSDSGGIRIPRIIFEESRLSGNAELAVDDDRIIIKAVAPVKTNNAVSNEVLPEDTTEEFEKPS